MEFKEWFANRNGATDNSCIPLWVEALMESSYNAALKLVEGQKPSTNTTSPKSAPEIVESNNACEYCIWHPHCKTYGSVKHCVSMSNFNGRRLRV